MHDRDTHGTFLYRFKFGKRDIKIVGIVNSIFKEDSKQLLLSISLYRNIK